MKLTILALLVSLNFGDLDTVQAASNVILIIVDDQEFESLLTSDAEGKEPMPKLRRLIQDNGATLSNFFTTTPSCCISRATIFTGMYAHNNLVTGNTRPSGCYSSYWIKHIEPNALPVKVKAQGYNTFFMGKYLNMYGFNNEADVPPGWDRWLGVMSGTYYNYNLSEDGVETSYGSDPDDYIVTNMRSKATNWLDSQSTTTPFFMVLTPPNPHGPTTPETKYSSLFTSKTSPRGGALDVEPSDKHWLMRYILANHWPLSRKVQKNADEKFVARWQTLKSVDDLVEDIVNKLTDKALLDDTYIMYTSDNGYHFNQFGRPNGKWLNYDTDIRVPFLIRGPGISARSTVEYPVLNLDLAPTILEISGASVPSNMDGQSFLTLVKAGIDTEWRTSFLVEYWGNVGQSIAADCVSEVSAYPDASNCIKASDCICSDAGSNTYTCVRTVQPGSTDFAYCKFEEYDNNGNAFVEAYDISTDAEQTNNLYYDEMSSSDINTFETLLNTLISCAGSDTCTIKTDINY